MQKVQRRVGKYLKRSADDQDVGVALIEFQQTEQTLDRYIEHVKAFQTAWGVILQRQLGIAEEFEALYKPMDGLNDPDDVGQAPITTPKAFLEKCVRLRATYAELESELKQEVTMIETKLLRPAWDVKESTAPLKKDIKRRENSKLDYERYLGRVEAARKKEIRSIKEEAALAQHESNLNQATYEYYAADDQLRKVLPAVVDAIERLMPSLLAIQIMLQHAMVAQLYTVLHAYCQQFRFPSPAPSVEQIIATWDGEFTSLRGELESGLHVIANGKAIHLPFNPPERVAGSTVTGLGLRNKLAARRTSSQGLLPGISKLSQSQSQQVAVVEDNEEDAPPAKPPRGGPGPIQLGNRSRIPSSDQLTPSSMPPTPYDGLTTPGSPWANGGSRRSSPSTPYLTPASGHSPTPQGEYFGRAERRQSSSSIASSIAAKKKPPPPPAKRIPSSTSLFVTALYDFSGQSNGDLAFSEGDRIKILKKSESTDDWWLGELRGVSGSFPANYVRAG